MECHMMFTVISLRRLASDIEHIACISRRAISLVANLEECRISLLLTATSFCRAVKD